MHFRDGGIGATDRKQRHQAEGPGQCQDRVGVRIHAVPRRMTKVMAILRGIATSNTAASGNRTSPMATKTAASIKSPTKSRLFTSGIHIRKTAHDKRPTAHH